MNRGSSPGPAAPAIAIVVPAFRHPSLLAEALESAVRQEAAVPHAVVVVNDGCAFPATHEVGVAYARAHPERVLYLDGRHRGPSGARNAGVRMALAAWPSVEAVMFLDADDRLWPTHLQAAWEALQADPAAGWFFPDLATFGHRRAYGDASGAYSVLQHLADNYCAGTSLVRRRMFEAGVWFDESQHLGHEDWEFWLQGIERGFRGRHFGFPGYRYRTRPESRNEAATRQKHEIVATLHAKHPALFRPRFFVETEHRELPRYAVHLHDDDRGIFTTDPGSPARVFSADEFRERLARGLAGPEGEPLPPLLVSTTRSLLDTIVAAGVAPGVLWRLQADLSDAKVSRARIEARPDDALGLEWRPGRGDASIVMVRTADVRRGVDSRSGLLEQGGRAPGRLLALSLLADEVPPVPHDAEGALRGFLERLSPRVEAHRRPSSTRCTAFRPPPSDPLALARLVLGMQAPFPAVAHRPGPAVAFVLGEGEAGDPAWIVGALAHEARSRAWTCHLLVVGSARARVLAEHRGAFDTVTVCAGAVRADDLLSLLGPMDLVVEADSPALDDALAALKRAGVATVSLAAASNPGEAAAVLRRTLQFEGVLDGILTVSEGLRLRYAALGIPEAKLGRLRVAPGFPVPPALAASASLLRRARGEEAPLRVQVLYDPADASDRAIAAGVRAPGPGLAPVEWLLEAPSRTSTALSHSYSFADVVLVAPGWRRPLTTVAEAQRFGCVPLGCAGPGMEELIEDGGTGFLLSRVPDPAVFVRHARDRLGAIAGDRERLDLVGRRAAEVSRGRTWAGALDALAAYLPPQPPAP